MVSASAKPTIRPPRPRLRRAERSGGRLPDRARRTGICPALQAGARPATTEATIPSAAAVKSITGSRAMSGLRWPERSSRNGDMASAPTSPTTRPPRAATSPSTPASASTVAAKWLGSAPLAASSPNSRWRRRTPTAKAAAATRTASTRARPPSTIRVGLAELAWPKAVVRVVTKKTGSVPGPYAEPISATGPP